MKAQTKKKYKTNNESDLTFSTVSTQIYTTLFSHPVVLDSNKSSTFALFFYVHLYLGSGDTPRSVHVYFWLCAKGPYTVLRSNRIYHTLGKHLTPVLYLWPIQSIVSIVIVTFPYPDTFGESPCHSTQNQSPLQGPMTSAYVSCTIIF